MIDLHAFMGNVGLLGSAVMFLAIPQPWALSLQDLSRMVREYPKRAPSPAA